MSWAIVFNITTYLAMAVIAVSIIVRFFKEFPIHVPIITALLLLSSVGGTYALKISEMTEPELMVHFDAGPDRIAQLRAGNNLLLYGVMITLIVVYAASVCEGISRLVKYLFKKWRMRSSVRDN